MPKKWPQLQHSCNLHEHSVLLDTTLGTLAVKIVPALSSRSKLSESIFYIYSTVNVGSISNISDAIYYPDLVGTETRCSIRCKLVGQLRSASGSVGLGSAEQYVVQPTKKSKTILNYMLSLCVKKLTRPELDFPQPRDSQEKRRIRPYKNIYILYQNHNNQNSSHLMFRLFFRVSPNNNSKLIV